MKNRPDSKSAVFHDSVVRGAAGVRPSKRAGQAKARAPQVQTGSGAKKKNRVLLVDDHPIVRQGLAELISRQADLTICGEAGDVHEAFTLIAKLRPDMAVIDVSLKDASGLELIKTLKVQDPNLPLLVLSMHDESLYAERALRAGALGYVMKQEASHKIVDAIRCVLKGEMVVSDAIKARLLRHLVQGQAAASGFPIERLSDRELQVFQLIGNGFATSQIARKLCLSIKTIETYRENLKQKLDLKGGAELLQQAIVWTQNNSAPSRDGLRPG